MGPAIILDKSSIQCLSADEIDFLYRYYTVNITPVLIVEILGDLMKPDKVGALSGKDVINLSNKLLQNDSAINAHYQEVMVSSLLGFEVVTDGRPVIPNGKWIEEPGGKRGVVFDETPEEIAIHRWRDGDFTKAEAAMSKRWRESTRSIDLNTEKEQYKKLAALLPQTRTLPDLVVEIDRFLGQAEHQTQFLTWLLYEFSIEPHTCSKIFFRWEQQRMKMLKVFAPYAFYCFKINVTFYIGIARNLLGTRATNLVDLEYAYYSPFAIIFSSRDNFHKRFVPPLLRADQTFLNGDDLKEDLRRMAESWTAMSTDERSEWLKINSERPPKDPESITASLWDQYMKPKGRTQRFTDSSSTPNLTAESIFERIKHLEAGGEPFHESEAEGDPNASMDFLVRKRTISIEDPCPCRSGKKFKDCHLSKMK